MTLPLVLLPGLLCDASLWRSQIEALGDVAIPWVADVTRHETFAEMARAILAEVPGERFSLAGLSMGGYLALEIMRQVPERVARLALLDTNARADTPERRQARIDLIALAEGGRFHDVIDSLVPLYLHPERLGDPALVGTVKDMARNVGIAAFGRQERAIMGRIDSRGHLVDIACPTLVLCGREDRLTPLDGHVEMAHGIRGARLEVIANCGHLSTLERPAEVNAALRRWLAA